MWMDIRFLSAELSIGRTFSFASSPTEPDLMITFKQGATLFKASMESVQPGDVMLITQYGSNGLRRDPTLPAVFLAGGVGIAPLRSMIKAGIDEHAVLNTRLIYVNRTTDFPFRRELEEWRQIDPSLRLHLVVSGTEGHLTRQQLAGYLAGSEISHAKYYLAGPPGIVSSAESILLRLHIAPDRILTDSFTGYE